MLTHSPASLTHVSDVWQGPGWWLASDGKWYPPEAQPGGVFDPSEAGIGAASNSELASDEAASSVAVAVETTLPEPEATPVVEQPAEKPITETNGVAAATREPAGAANGADLPGWQAIVEDEIDPVSKGVPLAEPATSNTTTPTDIASVDAAHVAQPVKTDPPAVDEDDDGWSSAFDEQLLANNGETVAPRTSLDAPSLSAPAEIPTMGAVEVPVEHVDDVDTVQSPLTQPAETDAVAGAQTAPTVASTVIAETSASRSGAVNAEAIGPIERNEAWRTPGSEVGSAIAASQAPTESVGSISTTPKVVDLAIPDESPLHTPEKSGRGWRAIAQGVFIFLAIIGLALAIIWYLYRTDDSLAEPEPEPTPNSEVGTIAPTPATEPDELLISIFDLRAGDCIVGEIAAGPVTEIQKVDCGEPHSFEVYREALIDSSIVEYDEPAIAANAEEICRTSLAAYIPPDDERDLRFKFLQPTEESWNRSDIPDRVITCLLYDEEGPLIGKAA